MNKLEKFVKNATYDAIDLAMEKANKKGMKYLRWEIQNGVIDEEQFNIKLYGTSDETKIKQIRKKFLWGKQRKKILFVIHSTTFRFIPISSFLTYPLTVISTTYCNNELI